MYLHKMCSNFSFSFNIPCLQVDGQDMDGKAQSEVVALLRNVKLGEMVNLEISRQVTEEDRFKVPRQLVIIRS